MFNNESWNNKVKFLLVLNRIKLVVSAVPKFSRAPSCAQYKVRVFLRRNVVFHEDFRRASEESRPLFDQIELQSEISISFISKFCWCLWVALPL